MTHNGSKKWLTVLAVCAGILAEAQYLMPATRQNQPAHSAAQPQFVDTATFKREAANLRADMRVLQEDFRLLVTRIEALEAERNNKDTLIRELQETVAMYERRLQAMEQKQVQAENRLRQEVAQALEQIQRASQTAAQQAVDGLRKSMVNDLARVEQIAVKAANTASRPAPRAVLTGAYKEVRVEQGDTLSAIAASAGVSVQTLRQVNNLQGNTIRIGQMLKIPVPQQ